MTASRARLLAASAGFALWSAYPFVFWSGGIAVHQYRCHLIPVTADRDPCFSDYIPVLEMMAFGLTIILAYPFALFAFSLFAPRPEERGRGWGLASRASASDHYPALQIAAAFGIPWALIHAKNYPAALYPYLIYWAAWLLWFAAGLWLSWPARQQP